MPFSVITFPKHNFDALAKQLATLSQMTFPFGINLFSCCVLIICQLSASCNIYTYTLMHCMDLYAVTNRLYKKC